jgi:ribosomal protein L23
VPIQGFKLNNEVDLRHSLKPAKTTLMTKQKSYMIKIMKKVNKLSIKNELHGIYNEGKK